MQANGYKLNSLTNVGHGAYLVGNNMAMYSNHNKSQNNVSKGLSFTIGDEIVVSLKG